MKPSPRWREWRYQTPNFPCASLWFLASHPSLPHHPPSPGKIHLLSVTLDCIFWNFIWTKSHSIFFFEGGSLASFTQHNGNWCWDLLMWLVSIVHCFLLLSSKHSIVWIWILLPQVVSAFTCRKTFRLLDFGYYRHSYFVRFCSLYG